MPDVLGPQNPFLRGSIEAIESDLTPQERGLVEYHRGIIGSGLVGRDESGRPVTVYSNTIEIPSGPLRGKFVTVPGWYGGKKHDDEHELWGQWRSSIESGVWPVYDDPKQADQRAKFIHSVMDIEGGGPQSKTKIGPEPYRPMPVSVAPPSALGMAQPPPLKPEVWEKLMAMMAPANPRVQGPVYESDAPTIASGMYARSPLDNQALQDFWNRLSLSTYMGAPLHQAFLDVQGTGNNAVNRYGNLDTKRTPLVGGRLEYQVNPNFAIGLEGMRGSADIVGQRGRHNNLGNIPYPNEFMAVSPSLKGMLPTEYGTPYVGVGPLLMNSKQMTSDKGASPNSFDVGLNAYGGYETPDIMDKLRAFIEAKYLYSNQTGGDVEGQFAGPFQQMSVLGGLKYKFGEPGK